MLQALMAEVAASEIGRTDRPYTLVAATRPITIRQLLTHTAGLANGRRQGISAVVQVSKQGFVLDFTPQSISPSDIPAPARNCVPVGRRR